jgi:hypothetical protein
MYLPDFIYLKQNTLQDWVCCRQRMTVESKMLFLVMTSTRITFSIAFFYLIPFLAHAQLVTINGNISDRASGENLESATVYETQQRRGVATNTYGFYSLRLPAGRVALTVSYVGYQTASLDFTVSRDTVLNFQLTPGSVQLGEVVVQGEDEHQQKPLGVVDIPVARLKSVPPLLGEPDIIKSLALTPGVSIGNEGTSGLLVRGGTPDQNLILLDEVPLYNLSHLFGFVSVLNPDAIKKVDLYKAGFPARFGSRLSSVIDITMKEGNNQDFRGEASVGLLSSRFLLEGPLTNSLKGRSSFMFSGRASYLGLFTLPNYIGFKRGDVDQFFTYWFYDVNAKINHRFKNGSQFFFSFYRGTDLLNSQEGNREARSKFNLNWGNLTATARYSGALNNKVFFRTLVGYSRYGYGIDLTNNVVENRKENIESRFAAQASVKDWLWKTTFEYYPSIRHRLRFGTELIFHTYEPTHIETTYPVNPDTLQKINTPVRAGEYAAYLEDDVEVTSWLRANLGVRGVLFGVRQSNYTSLEPRAGLNFLLPKQFAFKVAYSQMRQFIHLLSNNSVGLPNDIWVPATSTVPPQFSQQVAAGITKTLADKKLELSLEGYYKTMRQLIDYQTGNNFLVSYNNTWENIIERNGIGKSYGLELFVNKTKGRFTGWFAYTLAWNWRKFENINQGRWYAASYDRRHTIAITGSYKLKDNLDVAATWSYHSGQPITVPVAVQENFERGLPLFLYGDRNNYRMPAYHRLDISANFHRVTRRNRQATWSVGLYNAYNRANPYYLDFNRSYVYKDPATRFDKPVGINYKLTAVGVIPILPFISYSLKF